MSVWILEGCHCGAPAAAGTGALSAFVAADRTGEPVRGPRAVEAGKAEIPGEEVRETVQEHNVFHFTYFSVAIHHYCFKI